MHAFLTGNKTAPKPKPKPEETRKNIPWVEKYRPKTIDDVAHQEEVIAVLKKVLAGSDFPNLLFYGPPGTGKTSTILAAAKQMFGDLYKNRVLELNASDERGISVIRDKVKTFSQVTASAFRSDGKRCPPLKIIILDEADSMTSAAQAALRRTMEKHAKSTRFCLICNYVTRIIGPITSRCAKFRFKPLEGEVLKTRLVNICQSENVNCSDDAMQCLLRVSEGDLRKAITYVQCAFRVRGSDEITEADIAEISGVLPGNAVDGLLETCRSNSYEKVQENVESLMFDGYCGSQILMQVFDAIVVNDQYVNDDQKAVICDTIGTVEKRLMDGANEFIQIMHVCSVIMTEMAKS